ncbi:MAG: alpha/beta hydrolase [Nocardioides sp.]|nr:alpha/beta hydrolase [Nocardioides sp.]
MFFLLRQVFTAALTANAIRPVPGLRVGFPSFVAGWLTGELAPHLLVLTVTDAATHLTRRRRDPRALALAAASAAGLVFLVDQSRRVGSHAEAALVEGIGEGYLDTAGAMAASADLAVSWRSLVNPWRQSRRDVRVERNIAYGDAGRHHLLDLYLPPDPSVANAPVLLQVHGGGWSTGTKNHQAIPLMRHLAAKGWVCVSINYRLAPFAPFPAQVIDVKKAIAWVRQHIASYGGDPRYLAITGGSAGGHLCALAALTPHHAPWQPGFEDVDTTVQAAVPHYGIYDFAGASGLRSARRMRDGFLGPAVLRKRFSDDPRAFEDASPLLQVTPDDTPDFFVLHGTGDSMVEVEQARQFVARLREVSQGTVVYAELPGAQHGFDTFASIRSAQVVRAVDRYLHWHWNTWRAGLAHEDQMHDTTSAGDAAS